jgi:hexosaminidase
VYTPLNHLVDAVPPESETARRFNELVKRIVAGNASAEDWKQAHDRLVKWRDNDAALAPTLPRSPLTAELEPVSRELSQAAAIGLEALEDLQNHRAMEASAVQEHSQVLKEAEKPKAALRDMIVPPVELLVKAAGGVPGAGPAL